MKIRIAVAIVLSVAFALIPQRSAHAEEPRVGSTVIGDRELALGLVLMPWKEEAPSDVDRPPRLHDPRPRPLSDAAIRAEARHFETVQEYRRTRVDRRR